MKLSGLTLAQPGSSISAGAGPQKAPGSGFGEILKKSVGEVNARMQESAAMQEGLLTGEHSNIHETMIAMEKASLSFRMLTRAQTKVLDAYKEMMRMQL